MILLRKIIEVGEIDEDDDPKYISKSDPIFNSHKPDNFRARFNKLKKEYFSDVDGTVTFVLFNLLIFFIFPISNKQF